MGACPSAFCHLCRPSAQAVFTCRLWVGACRVPAAPQAPHGSRLAPHTAACGHTGWGPCSASFRKSQWLQQLLDPPLVPPSRAWCGRGRQEFPSTALILHSPDSPACSLPPGLGPGMRQVGTGGPTPRQGTAEGGSVGEGTGEGAQGGLWGHWLQGEKLLRDSFLLPCEQDRTSPRGLADGSGIETQGSKGQVRPPGNGGWLERQRETMQAEPGQILEGNLSGKLPGCSPARAACALPAPGPGWGSGDAAAPTGTWGTEHPPPGVVLPMGNPLLPARLGHRAPNWQQWMVPGNWHRWAPSHCGRASTSQTSCPSRMSAHPAHVTFPIWGEAAGNPRQPHTGPEPSPAVTRTQKVQRAQSRAQAAPASLGSVPCQHSPSEGTRPHTAASAAPAGPAAPARASQRVTQRN